MPDDITPHRPDDTPGVPGNVNDTITGQDAWRGPTYYGRPQLKAAPFETWVVGGYIFLAGLSGAAAMISALLDMTRGDSVAPAVRRGRYLSLLAPTIGSALLVWDLHTPKRFYNMLRISKPTSPMSIGTWILMGFSAFAGINSVAQFLSDRVPRVRWLRRAVRVTQVVPAIAGAGLSTYTASLLSATSTPLWAAAPRAMAVRFGSSSLAAGASALSLGESSRPLRRKLDAVTLAALTVELAATMGSHQVYRNKGVAEALGGAWGATEDWGATKFGIVAPVILHGLSSVLAPRRLSPEIRRASDTLSRLASLASVAGSLLLRVSIMGAGNQSARRPEISFRFSQPSNLP